MVFQYLEGAYKQDGKKLITQTLYRAKGNVFKIKAGRFSLDIRKKYFSQTLVRHRSRLPEKVWMPHPCGIQDPGHTKLEAGKLPHGRQLELHDLLKLFQTQDILLFHELDE